MGMRAEHVQVVAFGQGQLAGTVELVEALGAETLIYVNTDHGSLMVARQNLRSPLRPGDAVGVQLEWSKAHWFDANGLAVRA
jgi:multiple sugar transport system ATP-binding protein